MALAITTIIILHNLCVEMKDPDFRVDDPSPEIFDTDDFLTPGPLPNAVDLRLCSFSRGGPSTPMDMLRDANELNLKCASVDLLPSNPSIRNHTYAHLCMFSVIFN